MVDNTARVNAAVNRLIRLATDEEIRSLTGIAEALARDRGRRMVIREASDMPPTVFGRWCREPDYDLVKYAPWVINPERTIAHELGHMVLGHKGRPALELAHRTLPESSHDLATLMLQRDCKNTESQEEVDAEMFASLLLRRLKGGSRATRSAGVRSRLDEALG